MDGPFDHTDIMHSKQVVAPALVSEVRQDVTVGHSCRSSTHRRITGAIWRCQDRRAPSRVKASRVKRQVAVAGLSAEVPYKAACCRALLLQLIYQSTCRAGGSSSSGSCLLPV